MTTLPTPDQRHDGDLVVLLHEPTVPPANSDTARHVDIEIRLVNGKRWQRGHLARCGRTWPHLAAPTAAAIMSLQTDILELEVPPRRVRFASGARHAEFVSAAWGHR
jgi:hypothetical protein